MAAAFEEFGVMPELIKAVEEMGWTLPTDIQAEAIPLILGGGDVMAVRIFFQASPPSCIATMTLIPYVLHSNLCMYAMVLAGCRDGSWQDGGTTCLVHAPLSTTHVPAWF